MGSLLLFLLPLFFLLNPSQSQPLAGTDTTVNGYNCSYTTPCETYVFYRAQNPDLMNLTAISDLFGVSRLRIAQASNISSLTSPLVQNQTLFIPIYCACMKNYSQANITYQIQKGNTYYLVSTLQFLNLTTFQAVIVANPSLVPTNLTIGVEVVFPIRCLCPNKNQLQRGDNFLITYVVQPGNTYESISRFFKANRSALISANPTANLVNPDPFSTVLVPVSQLPQLVQPTPSNVSSPPPPPPPPIVSVVSHKDEHGTVTGLSIAVGVLGVLTTVLALVLIFAFRKSSRRTDRDDYELAPHQLQKGGGAHLTEKDFLADVSECLDKYKVYSIEELKEATEDFDPKTLIQGSVYKATIECKAYAVKKMRWDVSEELKILQKVNHHSLVRLEGFCINVEEGDCYLVYEYVENGSLHHWLHNPEPGKHLNWKSRLQIAMDVANGLQYMHEHTSPVVVHKDIKSSNILLDKALRAKIANFGLAKSGFNAITRHIVGTQGYMAPEYLGDGLVTPKLDVFAYGVVLLELVSGKEAAREGGRELLWVEVENVLACENKEERLRGWMDGRLFDDSCSVESVMNVAVVARACVSKDPSKRPSLADVVYILSKADELCFDLSSASHDSISVNSGVTAR
ncbi:hypothetical protein AMTRI_Chr09g36480 [Amborella trichopoda]|uniref:Protein kinase domain-containing protein n=1 Tax=Amborella trichopoda TaxID=13333 RepID=W1NKZ8_AMBTC|nr:serine/threonine receptor-like kinase NFP [Amborella trichopoda]ERM96517.1 hypothetical protein AMTR_s00001p00263560 [Amborella trichopoda]|eukprot:XP_006829101.1 serine/threonine receptor-like kinase NFP [Amborella trichopoda]